MLNIQIDTKSIKFVIQYSYLLIIVRILMYVFFANVNKSQPTQFWWFDRFLHNTYLYVLHKFMFISFC